MLAPLPYQEHGLKFPINPLELKAGEKVGVVLLSKGIPAVASEFEAYLRYIHREGNAEITSLKDSFQRFKSKLIALIDAVEYKRGMIATGGLSAYEQFEEDQRKALASKLDAIMTPLGVSYEVFLSGTFGKYSHQNTIQALQKAGISNIILLPLSPHFGRHFSGKLFRQFAQKLEEVAYHPTISAIPEFAIHPYFIGAVKERILEARQRFPQLIRESVPLVFVADQVMISSKVKRNDPYVTLLEATVELLRKELDVPDVHLAFMEKTNFGRKLLKPSLHTIIEEVAAQNKKGVLLIPLSCVHDQFEVDYFLDMVLRKKAQKLQIKHLEVTTGLNCHPLFIQALEDMVQSRIEGGKQAFVSWQSETIGRSEISLQQWLKKGTGKHQKVSRRAS